MSSVPLTFSLDDFARGRLPIQLLHRNDIINMTSAGMPPPLMSGSLSYRPSHGLHHDGQNRGTSGVNFDDQHMQIIVDVHNFRPEEISVKTSDGILIVEGKHKEKQDEYGYVSRYFKGRYVLSKDVDIERMVSKLSSDGMLTVSAPKKVIRISSESSVPNYSDRSVSSNAIRNREKRLNN